MNKLLAMLTLGVAVALAGCNATPKNEDKADARKASVRASLSEMEAADPGFKNFLDKAYGYVVFPSVGEGGLIIGGAHGKGEVYEQGKMIGYAQLTKGTIGLQAGGQAYTQVIAFENKAALDKFTKSDYELAAQASAVALKSGVAANAKYTDGVAIFQHTKGGLMAAAAVGGQKFKFEPLR